MAAEDSVRSQLKLSRVNFQEEAPLCSETSIALKDFSRGSPRNAETIKRFREFLPEFLGIDNLDQATPDNTHDFALNLMTDPMRTSNMVTGVQSVHIFGYITAIQRMDADLERLLDGREVPPQDLKAYEEFCTLLNEAMLEVLREAAQMDRHDVVTGRA